MPATPAALPPEVSAEGALGFRHVVHLHPRDKPREETPQPTHFAATIRACRAVAPGMTIGIDTSAWIAPGPQGRIDFQECKHLPDGYAARDNAALRKAAAGVFEAAGRPLA
ncbi:MAG: hypothetical protein AAF636_11660 [Pseudomonadota bacterium]